VCLLSGCRGPLPSIHVHLLIIGHGLPIADHKAMLFILVLSIDLCLLNYPVSRGLVVRCSLGWCEPINCL